jgi:hypothetical protein
MHVRAMRTSPHWLGQSFVVVAVATVVTGCAGRGRVSPDQQSAIDAAQVRADNRIADLSGCEQLRAPEGSKLAFRALGKGVQIYRWTGTSWSFVAPSATLFADAGGNRAIGTHFAGPTWQSLGGGETVGTVLQRCVPDQNAIPWLLLGAVSTGPGIFHDVTAIQRLNTVGGNAPVTPGTSVGEMANVPYTADYLFYRGP